MSPKERDELIDALLEGAITEADFLRLEAELSIDPAARRAYYDRQKLHLLLQTEAASLGAPVSTPASRSKTQARRRFFSAPNVLALAAALVALLSLGALFWQNTAPAPLAAGPEPTASGFGVVAAQVDAVWDRPLADGALVPQGRIRLQSGAAQLELFSGVNVVVEGEAEFEIRSAMEMAVHRGRIRARVPGPAQGFRIHTPEGEVVDLGTEFGLAVGDGAAEVHVLDGEVEWHTPGAPKQLMTEGQALRQSGGASATPDSAPAFLGLEELNTLRLQSLNDRRQQALAARSQLSADARLLAHYTVDATAVAARRLPNHAGASTDGAIVAAAPAADRFGQPGAALDFSPAGSRVRLGVPGEHGSVTLLCWVKINSLDRWWNSLFLTDGHDLHEPHWQIVEDGRLVFSVKKFEGPLRQKGARDKHMFYSPPFWSASLSGQWLMIATVYDTAARKVTHYLNGDVLSEETIPDDYLVEQVRIGSASIGNWSEPVYRTDPQFAVRNLNGSMDEFALFAAALTAQEIAEMYQRGKP